MKVRTFKAILDGNYRAQLFTEDFSQEEVRWITEQGDPQVDVGGSFGDESGITFSIPHRQVFLKAGFENGFDQSFDPADFEDAREYADLWAEEVRTRIFDEMQVLKDADPGSFKDESVSSMVYT